MTNYCPLSYWSEKYYNASNYKWTRSHFSWFESLWLKLNFVWQIAQISTTNFRLTAKSYSNTMFLPKIKFTLTDVNVLGTWTTVYAILQYIFQVRIPNIMFTFFSQVLYLYQLIGLIKWVPFSPSSSHKIFAVLRPLMRNDWKFSMHKAKIECVILN